MKPLELKRYKKKKDPPQLETSGCVILSLAFPENTKPTDLTIRVGALPPVKTPFYTCSSLPAPCVLGFPENKGIRMKCDLTKRRRAVMQTASYRLIAGPSKTPPPLASSALAPLNLRAGAPLRLKGCHKLLSAPLCESVTSHAPSTEHQPLQNTHTRFSTMTTQFY